MQRSIDVTGANASLCMADLVDGGWIRLRATGATLAHAFQVVERVGDHVPIGTQVELVLTDAIGPGVMARAALYQTMERWEALDFVTVRVDYFADYVAIVLRKCPDLPPELLGVVVADDGIEVTLFYPSARDFLRKVSLYTKTFYENALLADLKAVAADGLFVDVGANVGNHALYAAKILGRSVVAFEACAETFGYLERNVAGNGAGAQVTMKNLAVGRRHQRAAICWKAIGNSGATRLAVGRKGDLEVVPLDDVAEIRAANVAIVKVDVEGMEVDVLLGARRLLTSQKPVLVLEAVDSDALARLDRLLATMDYRRVKRHWATHMYEFRAV